MDRPDFWKITFEERTKHNLTFNQLNTEQGQYLNGEQAKNFMLKSGLSAQILADIWNLSDINKDGKLDRKEFSIACSLIKKVLTTGCKLPNNLPSSILIDPIPSDNALISSSSQSPIFLNNSFGSLSTTATISPINVPNVNIRPSSTPIQTQPPTSISSGIPPIPPTSRNKYSQVFQSNDTSQTGYINGQQARNLLLKTGLPQHVLAQIWNLSDYDNDGRLSLEEFIISMHLCDYMKTSPSSILPQTLPAELKPKPRSNSVIQLQPSLDSINDQLNQLNVSPPKQIQPVSFEDKRKENFDKGNAVLEAKRKALMEQAEREKREREEKERIEQEKKLKLKEEQERKRLAELERQAERQRLVEQQREEERKKIFEQREAARQELLRQQRIEWERQKKQELETQKLRLQEQLSVLKAKDKNIEYDVQQLNEKISVNRAKIDDTRTNVNDVTKVLESNKKLLEKRINECDIVEQQIKELNENSRRLSMERSLLMEKAKTINQDSPFAESYRNEMQILKNEQAQLQTFKMENERLETDINSIRTQIECLKHELEVSKNEINDLTRENDRISSLLTLKRNDFKMNADRSFTPKENYDALKEEIEKITLNESNNSTNAANSSTITPAITNTISPTNNFINTNNENASFTQNGDSICNPISNNLSSTSNEDQWFNQSNQQQQSQTQFDIPTNDIDFNVDWSNAFDNQPTSLGVDPFAANDDDPFTKSNQDPFQSDKQTTNEFDTFWPKEQNQDPFKNESKSDPFGVPTGQNDNNWGFEASSSTTASTNWAAFEDAFKTNDTFSSTNNLANSSSLVKYKALFNYEAQQSDELTLYEGDIITVNLAKKTDEGWSWGECKGRKGVFPTAYATTLSDLGMIQEENMNVSADLVIPQQVQNIVTKSESNGILTSPKSSGGKKVITIASYTAKKENHLSFQKNEIIIVREQQGVWWSGELNGKIGWFPKDYVEEYKGSSNVLQTNASKQSKNLFISLFAFESNEPGDLNFGQFELIEVLEVNGEWFTGCVEDTKMGKKSNGIFPSNYVVKFNFSDELILKNNFGITLVEYNALTNEELNLIPNEFVSIDQVSEDLQWTLVEKYDESTQILKKGWVPSVNIEKIVLSNNSNNANTIVNNTSPMNGAPIAATITADTSSSSTLSNASSLSTAKETFQQKMTHTNSINQSLASTASSTSSLNNQKEVIQPHKQQQQQQQQQVNKRKSVVIDKVIALYDFQANTPEAISFPKDAVIDIIQKNGDWWVGEFNGQSGLLPYNYVQSVGNIGENKDLNEIIEQEEEEEELNENFNSFDEYDEENLYENTENQNKIDDFELDNKIMNTHTDLANKYLNVIKELVQTEKNYVQNLRKVVEIYYYPLKQNHILNETELDTIFLNWQQIVDINTKFYNALSHKYTDSNTQIQVGDLLVKYLPRMKIYSKYVSGRKDSDTLIIEKMKTSPQFNELVNSALIEDSGDFLFKKLLLLPMQRLTQYSLLIDQLIKYSYDKNSDDYKALSQASIISSDLLKRINEEVGKKEDIEKLMWLEEHIPIAKAFGYKFQLKTNFMGDRRLIYYGSLTKESGKELYAFLLNDSLIMIEASENLWNEVFRPTQRLFNLYKTPILLDNIRSVQSKQNQSSQQDITFILSTEKDYVFRTTNPTLKNEWIKQIQKAIKEYQEKKQLLTHSIDPSLASKTPIGRLLLVVIEGQDLNIDLNDEEKFVIKRAFCEVKISGQKFATHCVENTQNPKWNTAMQFQIYDLNKEILTLSVYDKKLFVPNVILGKTHISISKIYKEQLYDNSPVTRVFRLADTKIGKVMVKMNISIYKK